MFLMRDEKEERKKQARSNKQRQSNTAHPRQSCTFTNNRYALLWDIDTEHFLQKTLHPSHGYVSIHVYNHHDLMQSEHCTHQVVIYSTLQIQGIKRFACQTRLLQTQNACKRCAKRVYYKRKTRVNAALNACKRSAKRSAKRVYYKRKTRLLHTKRVCWKRVLRDQSRQLEGQGCGSLV